MGSWNHTCAVSNLHITAGKDVVVFLLLKNHTENSFCYGNALYSVIPLPFYGKYDDYGGVEDCNGFGLPIILNAIKERLYKFGQGPNECHDCEVNKENFTIEKLFEADHEDRLGIEDPYRYDNDLYSKRELEKKLEEKGLTDSQQYELDRLAAKIKKVDTFRQVTHVVVHGDIFKSIIEKWYIEDYVGEGKGTTGYGNNYNYIYFKDLISHISEYVQTKRLAKEELNRETDISHKVKRILYDIGNSDWNSPNLAARWMGYFGRDSSGSVWGLIDVQEYVRNYIDNNDWDGLTKFTHEVLTAAWINSFMSYTRKIWVKQSGQGSQNSEPLGYKVLANAVLDILEEERREYEGDFEEEDDVLGEQV